MMQFLALEFGSVVRVLQVALGIGLVIFVHELGHFIAARWCGVRVELFSIGFGPKIFGWKRGSTTYQLALIPMGGYVKMAGDEVLDGASAQPDELPSKSVGQRFFIYSGGVLMNVLLALVVLPPLLFFGVTFSAPLIGDVTPGGAAWKAGIVPGTRVVAIDGQPVNSFEDLFSRVGLSDADEIAMLVRAPGAAADTLVNVRPLYSEDQGVRAIGVAIAADPDGVLRIAPDSPAYLAGLRDGDRLNGVNGLSEDLPNELLLSMHRGDPLNLQVLRGAESLAFQVQPRLEVVPTKKRALYLGIEPVSSRVIAVRASTASDLLGLQPEDRLLSLDGRPILRPGDFAMALRAAKERSFTMRVERERNELTLEVPALDDGHVRQLLLDVAVVADTEGTRAAVHAGSAAERFGLLSGDRIVGIGDRTAEEWKDIPGAIKDLALADTALKVRVQRSSPDGSRQHLEFDVIPGPLQSTEYGLMLSPATYLFQAATFGEAVRVGAVSSWRFMVDIWLTLSGLFRGTVSHDKVGGIILIAQSSYAYAGLGLAKLIFFLCTLSLNLAFINVLPIPVLDGGHLFFLLVEKVKGSPVNQRIMGYSQMVGLVLILGLVVFVTFNDLRRWLS